MACLLLSLLWAPSAAAQSELRRPGLGGPVTARRMTAAHNSLGLIFGPLQTPLFGQRFGGFSPDGGISYEAMRASAAGVRDEYHVRGGVVFGLSPQLEAGALFLSFRASPEFHYEDFPVYITYSWDFDWIELGARFSFITPIEAQSISLNPGAPVLMRFRNARLDTGLFLPVETQDGASLGLHVPVRLTYNVTPRWFLGVESGVYEAAFGRGAGASSSLGGFAGYTTILGPRVVDFAARFYWDEFLRYAPGAGQDAFEPSSYQLFLGATLHSKVL